MSDENDITSPVRRGRSPGAKTGVDGTSRAEMREEDPRARAAKRASEIRQHLDGGSNEDADRFKIEASFIPDGWSYEWKRKSLWGKEDPAYEVELARNGWEPVPASRHPSMMPKGTYETIERDGMILMERPKELTDEAHYAELRRARMQVKAKEQQLTNGPDGTFERERPLVKKSYESMPIPKE